MLVSESERKLSWRDLNILAGEEISCSITPNEGKVNFSGAIVQEVHQIARDRSEALIWGQLWKECESLLEGLRCKFKVEVIT